MSVVPFKRKRRQPDPQKSQPTDIAARFRHVVDCYQVLALSKPLVAGWLIEWLELFLRKHLE